MSGGPTFLVEKPFIGGHRATGLKITAATAAVLLAGCQHLAGHVDRERLIGIAVSEAARRGFSVTKPEQTEVADGGKTWDVNLDPPCPHECTGGPIIVSISKRSLRVTGFAVLE